jgi:hypothetical protein
MPFREKHLLSLCLLFPFCVGYYFFGMLLPASHVGTVTRNLAGGYEYGNDFYQVWITSRELLAHRTDPYTPDMQRRIETGLYGRPLDRTAPRDAIVPYRGYSYPLMANLLTAPLGLLSFHIVQILLSLLLPLCVAATVIFWCSAFGLSLSPYSMAGLSVVTLGTCPVLQGIYALQPTLIVAALIAASMALLRQGRLASAGILLSLGSIKPHLIGPLVLWLTLWAISDWTRRKTFLISFGLCIAVQLLATQLWLPEWWLGWWHSLAAYRQLNSAPPAQLVLGTVAGRVVGVISLALALLAAVRWRRATADSSSFLLVSAFVLATTVVVASSTIAVYDQILLLPGILWLWSERHTVLRADRPVRIITLVLLTAFFWPWVTASFLTIASPVFPWARSFQAVLFPIATAALFPVILLALLTLLLWQALLAAGAHDRLMAQQALPVRRGS